MFDFFGKESLVDSIVRVAGHPCFDHNRAYIVSDIVYDRKGARSMLSNNKAMTEKVGNCLGIKEDAAKQLEADVMTRFAFKKEITNNPPPAASFL
jgi:hypothetical protein